MLFKTLALAAAISMGAATLALAGTEREADGRLHGYRIGPTGQVFGGPRMPRSAYYGFGYAPYDYAYAPRRHRVWTHY